MSHKLSCVAAGLTWPHLSAVCLSVVTAMFTAFVVVTPAAAVSVTVQPASLVTFPDTPVGSNSAPEPFLATAQLDFGEDGTIDGFQTDLSGPFSIAPDETRTCTFLSPQTCTLSFSVVFSPTSPGLATGSVDVGFQTVTGPSAHFAVDLRGTGIGIAPVPAPIAGAGLPGLILASGGLLAWWRRRPRMA